MLKVVSLIGTLLIIGWVSHTAMAQSVLGSESEAIPLFNGYSLEGWEITNFGAQGQVEVRDSMIVIEFGDPMTGITWKGDFPRSNYEVTLEAMRIEGGDFFTALTFPVKDSHASLIVGGWGGGVVGISSIDGYDASENETSSYHRFEWNQWYPIRLRVTDDSIKAWIDEENVVDFAIEDHEMSIRIEVGLSRPFGVATWRTTGAIRNFHLRLLKDNE